MICNQIIQYGIIIIEQFVLNNEHWKQTMNSDH